MDINKTEEELIKAEKARYMREWRKKNRERLNKYQKEYYRNNKDKVAEYDRQHWLNKAKERADVQNEAEKLKRMAELDDLYCVECSVSRARFRIKRLGDVEDDNQFNIIIGKSSDWQTVGVYRTIDEAKGFIKGFKKNYEIKYPFTVV